jgi:hypothetical protein
MQASVLRGESRRVHTSVAATADAAGTASFLNTLPWGSCSSQIGGSVE